MMEDKDVILRLRSVLLFQHKVCYVAKPDSGMAKHQKYSSIQRVVFFGIMLQNNLRRLFLTTHAGYWRQTDDDVGGSDR